jgi:WS/DGAT/MGAT family acyltransferase
MTAPRTPFNGPLTARRCVALTDCRMDDLRRARTAFGTTVNDVVLAAATTALRLYLADRDALPDRALVASVPMSLRTVGDGDDLTPRATNLMIPLPVHVDDPVERLESIRERTAAMKDAPHGLGPDLTRDWVGLTPAAMVRGATRAYSALGLDRLPSTFNTIVSNVAGSPIPLYLGGARVTATYPMGPLIASAGLNLTVLSQGDQLHIGVIACPDLVDDVEAIAEGFVAGVQELARLANDVDE